MALLAKAALAALLLGCPIASANDLVAPDALVSADDETTQPVEHNDDIGSSLLVSYSTTQGLANVEALVAQHKGQGKGVSLLGVKEFKRPQLPKGPPALKGASSRAGGQGGQGGGQGSSTNKGKGRWRRLETSDPDLGFAVVSTPPDATDAEAAALSGLEGVTAVERDVEMTIDDVAGLRGPGPSQHAKDIMEAMRGKLPGHPAEDVEYAPTPDGEAHRRLHDARRLVEETPWGIDMVNVSHLWAIEPKKHVTICVIDTGYDITHEDLPKNVTGWHPAGKSGVWNIDGHGHGTHCAGTIGAVGTNGVGVVGVNPDPSRFTFRIGKGLTDSGSGSSLDVIDAVLDCRDQGADVISMSLGSSSYSSASDATYQDVYDDGVFVIAAAGNTYSDSNHYPSGYKSVMSVASITSDTSLSGFSTRNQQVEIAAPGSAVQSTLPLGNNYAAWSGTSMATPHVAGVAALLISHFPECTQNQIRNAMIRTTREPPAEPRNSPGWDKYYGWGIVNAGNAYELLSTLGCEGAGGAFPNAATNQTLSEQALGGVDQKQVGCLSDEQCHDANLCLGEQKCNLATNTCYVLEGTTPNCDDGKACTIDTCDPTKQIFNGVTDMCVHTPKQCEDGNMCNGVQVCEEATGNCIIDTPAVNCDDGDACTIDKCITSTGLCQYTDKSCDDGNACTLGDHCNSSTGCVFAQPIADCCGNAECEASENAGTCPVDCSDSITTTLDPSTAYRGSLGTIFNVATKSKNMTITGVGIHCTLPPEITGTAHVYSIAADYFDGGNWYKKSSWDLVAQKQVTCAGLGQATQVTFDNLVDIGKYSRQAFNIFVTTDDINRDYPYFRNAYGHGGRYATYSENSYLKIEVGSGNFCTSGFCAISTPNAFSGTMQYVVVDDSPTASPTISNMPTTPFPSFQPTTSPSKGPTGEPTTARPSGSPTPAPSKNPTTSPTPKPTESPTDSPTSAPSVSLAPTPFQSQTVVLQTGSTSSASVIRAAYFEVQGAAEWAKITDLMITTYGTKQLEVYFKYGSAVDYENMPCAWKKVAETSSSWNGGYWKKVYPPWTNGFDPVVVPPNEMVSFYVVNMGSSYGILSKSHSNSNRYHGPWISLDATSPVGAVTMSNGRSGYNDQRFNPRATYYRGYGLWGGLKLETMRPGSTESPTMAPTMPYTPGLIESPMSGATMEFNGLQFDVDNMGAEDVIVNKLSVVFSAPGTKAIEVWYRNGSHKGTTSGCDNWNNWCGDWTKLTSGNKYSGGSGSYTDTPTFVAVAKAGQTTSFAVVSGSGFLLTKPGIAANVVDDGVLKINLASAIEDYHGSNLQSVHELAHTDMVFEGKIHYDVAHSTCAVHSKQPWAVMDSAGASSMSGGGGDESGEPEVESIVNYDPNLGGGGDGGGAVGPSEGGPVEDFDEMEDFE